MVVEEKQAELMTIFFSYVSIALNVFTASPPVLAMFQSLCVRILTPSINLAFEFKLCFKNKCQPRAGFRLVI